MKNYLQRLTTVKQTNLAPMEYAFYKCSQIAVHYIEKLFSIVRQSKTPSGQSVYIAIQRLDNSKTKKKIKHQFNLHLQKGQSNSILLNIDKEVFNCVAIQNPIGSELINSNTKI